MSLDMTVTIILLVMLVVCGTIHFFDERGGWTLFYAEYKRKK